MATERKLREWERAGVITPEVAQQIRDHEARAARPVVLYAVAGIGALAIFIGLVSVVAANWDLLSGSVKLGVDLVVVAGLGWAILRAHTRGIGWLEDALILVHYGLVLASIGLISQVYQLGGATHAALLTWTALTALVVSRGHSGVLAVVWVCGMQTTYGVTLATMADDLDHGAVAAGLVYLAPLALLAVGWSDTVRRWRPSFARAFVAIGWAELLLCGTLGPFAFYEDTAGEDVHGLWVGLVAAAVVTAYLWTRSRTRGARVVLSTTLVLSFMPALISPGDLELVAALCFVGYWALIGWAAHERHLFHVLNMATAFIGIRILVVYFEVFGSLLDTGLGLISGGLLTLLLAWIWTRKRRDFGRQLARETDP